MRLIEVTLDYPYTNGETFCAHELEIAEKHFDEILLISMSGHFREKSGRYLPANARLINARKSRYEPLVLVKSFFRLFSRETAQEIFFAKRKLRVKESYKQILREIFIYYYYETLLKRIFRQEEIGEEDIVYSYWMAAPAFGIAKMKERCFKVSRAHGFDCFISRCYQPFRREVIEGLDRIVSISEAGKKDIEENLLPFVKASPGKIAVFRLGIIRSNEMADFEGKKRNCFTIVSCSNINSVKRLDLIVDALLEADMPLEWIHIGDGEYGEQIRERAKALEKRGFVKHRFMGVLSQQEIYRFYESSHIDLFINCSDSEGIPVSIMEAMSFGIPVIARDVGGNREIVNGENGILLKPQICPAELWDAIASICRMDGDIYIEMRKNAFNFYREHYMAQTNYDAFFTAVKNMAEEREADFDKSYE